MLTERDVSSMTCPATRDNKEASLALPDVLSVVRIGDAIEEAGEKESSDTANAVPNEGLGGRLGFSESDVNCRECISLLTGTYHRHNSKLIILSDTHFPHHHN